MHPPINSNLQFGGSISIYSIFFPFPFSGKQHQSCVTDLLQSDAFFGAQPFSSGMHYAPARHLSFDDLRSVGVLRGLLIQTAPVHKTDQEMLSTTI